MLDKVVFRKKIDMLTYDIDSVAAANNLEMCTCGDEIYYQSNAWGNLNGIFIRIKDGKIEIKCSLHKVHNKRVAGALDNSGLFTLRDAIDTIYYLFDMICIPMDDVTVSYYEVGISMKMARPPIEYIERAQSFDWADNREMFNDANFCKYRQITTEKSRHIKKVFKMYDKTFEAAEKGRTVEADILRCETIYKRQTAPISDFLDMAFLRKITKRWYRDWSGLQFKRHLSAPKGVKASQLDKASAIIAKGVEAYYNENRQLYIERIITKKQWETIRTFCNNWDMEKDRYKLLPGKHEKEYQSKLLSNYQLVTL